jgi:hypothetical protein
MLVTCPICNKEIDNSSDDVFIDCPDCDTELEIVRGVAYEVKDPETYDEDDYDDDDEDEDEEDEED